MDAVACSIPGDLDPREIFQFTQILHLKFACEVILDRTDGLNLFGENKEIVDPDGDDDSSCRIEVDAMVFIASGESN
jgi:hypothetical protein